MRADQDAATAKRLAVLQQLHKKWSFDHQAAVGVNPELAEAIAQALDDLTTCIQRLENEVSGE